MTTACCRCCTVAGTAGVRVEDELRGVYRRGDGPRVAWLGEGDKYLAHRGVLEHMTEQAYNDTVITVERPQGGYESAAARRCLP